MRNCTAIASVLVLFLLSAGVRTQSAQTPVPAGEWGGKGIKLTVTSAGANIEYDCAAGTIDERLLTDASGKFVAAGRHAFGQGGPREKGERPSKRHAARYEGTRDANTMRLTVTLPGLGRKVGEFTLELGRRASLDRCG